MPMAETPLAHVLVEVATMCTGDPTVLPLVGEVTETAPKADAADRRIQPNNFLMCAPNGFLGCARTGPNISDKFREACRECRGSSTYVQWNGELVSAPALQHWPAHLANRLMQQRSNGRMIVSGIAMPKTYLSSGETSRRCLKATSYS